jgi:glycosyltransferase involved in cell wall biosynthesis
MGLADCIHFVGSRGQAALPDWYRAADLSVLSSSSEGVPNVLRESLACGTPFIATAVGGIDELIDDPWRLTPPGDAGALAEAMARAMKTPSPLPAARMPSWAESAEQLLGILRPLVETARNSVSYRRAA